MKRMVADRAWDEFEGYLFDIDGTLLHCTDAVHYFAFCEALTAVAGRTMNLDGVVAHGNVDTGILRDALRLGGVREEDWRPRVGEMRGMMCLQVEANKGDFRIEVLPGVREVLGHLRGKGAVLGVATGNFAEIGRAKLEHAGLMEFFAVEGWSDGFETRADVFGAAVGLMRARLGAGAAICVVGDTPADVAAAKVHELPVIAVGTGIYPREELVGADLVVGSLGELA